MHDNHTLIITYFSYLKLVKKGDPSDYDKNSFNDLRTNNFKVYIITKNILPPEELIDRTYPIRVIVPM